MQKALWTAEAEYYSASLGAVEVIYLRTLLKVMGFAPTSPTPVYEDNTACIEWSPHNEREGAGPVLSRCGRMLLGRSSGLAWRFELNWSNNVIGEKEHANHIDIRKHFAHEAVQLGHLRLTRVATADQLADVFTKNLQPRLHAACISGILGKPWPTS